MAAYAKQNCFKKLVVLTVICVPYAGKWAFSEWPDLVQIPC
jgi:hypothetical protein